MQWGAKQEVWGDNTMDWLLRDNPVVVDMLEYERKMLRHHSGKDLWEVPTSLAHQAVRQDPGLYMLVACCMGQHRIVATPFKGEGTIFVELDLDEPDGSPRVATVPAPPTRPRLSFEWSGVTDDGVHITGPPAGSSWARYAAGHAQWAHDVPATTVQLRSVYPLASALLCQLNWNHPSVIQNCATLFSKDADAPGEFIFNTRQKILKELMIAYHELIGMERFWHEGHSYGVKAAAEQSSAEQPSVNQPSKKAT